MHALQPLCKIDDLELQCMHGKEFGLDDYPVSSSGNPGVLVCICSNECLIAALAGAIDSATCQCIITH